jgi:hypothetical protein
LILKKIIENNETKNIIKYQLSITQILMKQLYIQHHFDFLVMKSQINIRIKMKLTNQENLEEVNLLLFYLINNILK